METSHIPREALWAAEKIKSLLSDGLLGLYLYGSAVLGGLHPDSDVDLLAVCRTHITEAQRRQLAQMLLRFSARPGSGRGRPLEVTVVCFADVIGREYPRGYDFMYGEWMRDEIESGHLPQAACDPDMVILLRQAREHSVPLYGPAAPLLLPLVSDGEIRLAIRDSLPHLLSGIDGDERNVLLTLARMWYTLCVGDLTSKDMAAAWAVPKLPPTHAAVLERAAKAYLGMVKDCWTGEKEAAAAAESMKMEIESALSRTEYVSPSIEVLSVREHPSLCGQAIDYIAGRWADEKSRPVYENGIGACISSTSRLPQWYLLRERSRTIGCAGLIPNDFISRMDLYPWLCALYVEKDVRGHGFGALLIERVRSDAAALGYEKLYLATDLIGYYERYGFSYLGDGFHPWGAASRIYAVDLTVPCSTERKEN